MKHLSRGAGRPEVQRLVGAQGLDVDARLFFFSRSGYAAPAVAYAEQMGVALFAYDGDGAMQAVNATAVRVLKNRQRIVAATGEASLPKRDDRTKQVSDLDDVGTLVHAWVARREADISGHGEGVRLLWNLPALLALVACVWAIWRAFTADEFDLPYGRIIMVSSVATFLLANLANARGRKYARSDAARALKEIKGIDVRTAHGEARALELVREAARRIPGIAPAIAEGDAITVAKRLRQGRPGLKGVAAVAYALTTSTADRDGGLATQPLGGEAQPSAAGVHRSDRGQVWPSDAAPAAGVTTVAAEEDGMPGFDELFDQVNLVVSRQEIERRDIQPVLQILKRGLSSPAAAVVNKERYSIAVHGYDADPRELWEIEEVRAFFYALDEQFPYWLWFLDRAMSSFLIIMLCHVDVEPVRPGQLKYSKEQAQELMVEWWLPKARLVGEFAMADEAELEQLSEDAFQYVATGHARR